jgi:hypothetical protein
MPQFYVATLACYVVVGAENSEQARELGRSGLQLCRWHHELINSEAQMRQM